MDGLDSSRKVAWVAIALGAFAALIAYGVFRDSMAWPAYLVIGLVAMGGSFNYLMKLASEQKMIDRGDWPTKR